MKKAILATILMVLALAVALISVVARTGVRNHGAQKYNLGCVTTTTEKPLTDCRE